MWLYNKLPRLIERTIVFSWSLDIQGHLLKKWHLDHQKKPIKHQTSGGMAGCLGDDFYQSSIFTHRIGFSNTQKSLSHRSGLVGAILVWVIWIQWPVPHVMHVSGWSYYDPWDFREFPGCQREFPGCQKSFLDAKSFPTVNDQSGFNKSCHRCERRKAT